MMGAIIRIDIEARRKAAVSIADCRRVVGEYFRIRDETMLGPKTKRAISRPRQMAMTLARELTNHSSTAIGFHFGGRDHTTVLHAMRRISALEAESDHIHVDMQNFRLTLLTYKFQQEAAMA